MPDLREYEDLANGVIRQAVSDYKKALKAIKIHGVDKAKCVLQGETKSKKAITVARDCERFFRGEWFRTLTTLDGETLIKRLKANIDSEVNSNDSKRVSKSAQANRPAYQSQI